MQILSARRLALLSALAVSGLACGDDFDPEAAVTISQGVFGVTTSMDDVCTSKCEGGPHQMTLLVRARPQDSEVATATSDKDGFYEMALEPGDYRICTTFERCTEFSVGSGERVRLDYEMSVGPGWSR